MLRYYFIFKDDRYHLLNDKVNLNMQETYSPKKLGTYAKYVEVFFDVNIFNPEIQNVVSLDVTHISPLAIKAANDHNQKEAWDPDKDVPKDVRRYKLLAKQLVDTMLEHGNEFEIEFKKLIEKFPISPKVMPEGIKILG